MAHRQQALIDKLVEERGKGRAEERDHSLQGKALERAMGKRVPRTLTPWEWEQYYEEHGVPESHRQDERESDAAGSAHTPWWKRWLRLQ